MNAIEMSRRARVEPRNIPAERNDALRLSHDRALDIQSRIGNQSFERVRFEAQAVQQAARRSV